MIIRNRARAIILTLMLAATGFAATTSRVIITGTILLPSGSPLNGKAQFYFPFAGAKNTADPACPSCSIIFQGPVTYPIVNGHLVGINGQPALLVGNGDISPKNTYYQVLISDSLGIYTQSYYLSIPSVTNGSTFDIGAAIQTSITINNISFPASSLSSLPTTPQYGDIIRYNYFNDSKWDATNYAQKISAGWAIDSGIQSIGYGSITGAAAGAPVSIAVANPSATEGWGRTWSVTATASANTLIGVSGPFNGNNSLWGVTSFYRLSQRLSISSTTNVRFWIGIGCWNNGSGLGINNAVIMGTTAYAQDTPNKTTIAFRYSAGTDTTWKAVVINAGVPGVTVVDTLITPDTLPHTYDINTNSNSTALFFLIDGTQVATITTNIPPPASIQGNPSDGLASLFWTGDNKNTNNAMSATWYWSQISQK